MLFKGLLPVSKSDSDIPSPCFNKTKGFQMLTLMPFFGLSETTVVIS
jgi:hypothetical protein